MSGNFDDSRSHLPAYPPGTKITRITDGAEFVVKKRGGSVEVTEGAGGSDVSGGYVYRCEGPDGETELSSWQIHKEFTVQSND